MSGEQDRLGGTNDRPDRIKIDQVAEVMPEYLLQCLS